MTTTTTTHRAGDIDRQRTAARLGQALAQGYLELPEYEQRVQDAFQTQTTGELRELVADLPLARIRRADPRRRAAKAAAARKGVAIHFAAFLAVNAIVLTTWAATGVAYFWPIWPILGTAIGFVSHTLAARPLTKVGV